MALKTAFELEPVAPRRGATRWPTGRIADAQQLLAALTLSNSEPTTPVERVLAAWMALGPDPTAVARVAGATVAEALELMGDAAKAGITRDDGALRGAAPDTQGLDVAVVSVWAMALTLAGEAETSRDATVPLGNGVLAEALSYRAPQKPAPEPSPPAVTLDEALSMVARIWEDGMSVGWIANAVGVVPATVHALLNRHRLGPEGPRPQERTLEKLDAYLGVTIRRDL